MARSWYRLTVKDLALVCSMAPERAAALQGAGYHLEPATRPADAGERVLTVAAALLRPGRPFGGER